MKTKIFRVHILSKEELSYTIRGITKSYHYEYRNLDILLLLSHFSRVQLCATTQTAANQLPLSLGFSRQEHWSGLPFPSPMHESEKWKWSHSVVSNSSQPHGLQPTRLLHPWDFPGKSTGVGCHHLLCFLSYTRKIIISFLFIIISSELSTMSDVRKTFYKYSLN